MSILPPGLWFRNNRHILSAAVRLSENMSHCYHVRCDTYIIIINGSPNYAFFIPSLQCRWETAHLVKRLKSVVCWSPPRHIVVVEFACTLVYLYRAQTVVDSYRYIIIWLTVTAVHTTRVQRHIRLRTQSDTSYRSFPLSLQSSVRLLPVWSVSVETAAADVSGPRKQSSGPHLHNIIIYNNFYNFYDLCACI